MKKNNIGLLRDAGIIVSSIIIAVIMVQTGVLANLLHATDGMGFISSFIAGFFFTSIFTTAPAMAALGEIAQTNSLFYTALFGAFGAMCGDFLIFKFVRDTVSEHLLQLTQSKSVRHRLKLIFKLRFFRWFTFFLGGLIIASPLPDEIGLSLLGFSNVKTSLFLPVSFIFNFLGILLLGLSVRTFL